MKKTIIMVLNIWWVGFLSLLTIASSRDRISMGFVKMIWGLGILWIVGAGIITYAMKGRHKFGEGWRLKFVVLSTVLAMIEEAIATTMTNLAPVFGLEIGEAYITASANYIDVITFHSVVIFIPMFYAWSRILRTYDFSPFQGLILFGITGLMAEIISFGPQNLIFAGFWILVYGLMVYLPLSYLPERDGLERPGIVTYLKTIFFPILWAIPVAIMIGIIHQVSIHFT